MMKIPIYQVDAFTADVFSGNPAAVCFLEKWIDDSILQKIAEENNLSETAFLVGNATGYDLRWFTPATEVALCGHATLASAFILFTCLKWPQESISFRTRQSGELIVTQRKTIFEMDFPARPAHPIIPPPGLVRSLGVNPLEILGSEEDLLVVLSNEKAVRKTDPDFGALNQVDCRGVIITARGDNCDFVSRFFAPQVGIPEDPVTGSAHCVLIPYWSTKLGKTELHALQVSKRGGELFCRNAGDRVKISGKAALFMEGSIVINT
ncbi:MAG: PhzF family phenazine biosynthesis protein [Thermodesulfobacteriota bacterium]